MKLQIRNNKVVIDGYVNATDRFSKPLKDRKGTFIEKIMPNAFKRALEKTKNVLVLLNHKNNRILADTKSGTAKLYEDNVGLRAIVEIEDADVIEDAKKGRLRGWSFRFIAKDTDNKINDDGIEERTIKDLDLYEVSIINSEKTPAYYGTSIELRDNEETLYEYRFTEEEVKVEGDDTDEKSKVEDKPLTNNQKRELLHNKLREMLGSQSDENEMVNCWVEDIDNDFIYVSNVDKTGSLYKIPYSINNGEASIDIDAKVKVMRSGYVEIREVPEQQSDKDVEKIDYSNFKERLKKIKEEN